MRAPLMRLGCLLSLLIASSASAVTMAWTPIGDPGNAYDPAGDCASYWSCGGVSYSYSIGTYEVTNSQYVEFLNSKAASDPLMLYDTYMAYPSLQGGITRSGVSGAFTYSTINGRANMPVSYVSFFDALRFANWMNNGQGGGDTETGAYTLLGGSSVPSNASTVTRNLGATVFVPTEHEWYKAAYYDGISDSYFDFPAGSSTPTTCSAPTVLPNRANCYHGQPYEAYDLTDVGSYPLSASPYGTFDQGGNVWEWTDAIVNRSQRKIRGGSDADNAGSVSNYGEVPHDPNSSEGTVGFRLAMVPEPGTGLLVIAGLLGLASWRRARA
jgi:formylglycine-generating enzyme required for sulfatase activity